MIAVRPLTFPLPTPTQANTYNVEIMEPGPPGQAMDTMELTLLSRKRHHEALDGYSAPSQGSPRSVLPRQTRESLVAGREGSDASGFWQRV